MVPGVQLIAAFAIVTVNAGELYVVKESTFRVG